MQADRTWKDVEQEANENIKVVKNSKFSQMPIVDISILQNPISDEDYQGAQDFIDAFERLKDLNNGLEELKGFYDGNPSDKRMGIPLGMFTGATKKNREEFNALAEKLLGVTSPLITRTENMAQLTSMQDLLQSIRLEEDKFARAKTIKKVYEVQIEAAKMRATAEELTRIKGNFNRTQASAPFLQSVLRIILGIFTLGLSELFRARSQHTTSANTADSGGSVSEEITSVSFQPGAIQEENANSLAPASSKTVEQHASATSSSGARIESTAEDAADLTDVASDFLADEKTLREQPEERRGRPLR